MPLVKDIVSGISADFTENYKAVTPPNRGFTPIPPVAPYDDFYLEFKVKFCPGATINPVYRYGGALYTALPGGGEADLVSELSFALHHQEDGGGGVRYGYYRVEMLGSPYVSRPGIPEGITRNTSTGTAAQNMEILVEKLRAAGRGADSAAQGLKLEIGDLQFTNRTFDMVPMTGCYHLNGANSAAIKFTSMRGKTAGFNALGVVNIGRDMSEVARLGANQASFATVDPFKYYNARLAHYADLGEHDDNPWPKEWISRDLSDYSKPPAVTLCDPGNRVHFFNWRSTKADPNPGYTQRGQNVVFMQPGNSPITYVHETGHALCMLEDERLDDASSDSPQTNCVSDPKAAYSAFNFGIGVRYFGDWGVNARRGCGGSNNLYRPSDISIMTSGSMFVPADHRRFNIVSCGYCTKYILGSSSLASRYFQSCKDSMTCATFAGPYVDPGP